jgi:hypothetical protein
MISGRHVHRVPHVHNGVAVNGAWNNAEGNPADYSLKWIDVLQGQTTPPNPDGTNPYYAGEHINDDADVSTATRPKASTPPRWVPGKYPSKETDKAGAGGATPYVAAYGARFSAEFHTRGCH